MHSFDELNPRLVLTAVVTEETEGNPKKFAKKKKGWLTHSLNVCTIYYLS